MRRVDYLVTRIARQADPPAEPTIALLGTETDFDCSVESSELSEVSIWWQKDKRNVTINNVDDKYAQTRSAVIKEAASVVSSKLTVKNVTWEDDGNYSCKAKDGESGQLVKDTTRLVVEGNSIIQRYI